MYDLIIIGTGPAGLSAAINAKIRNKKFKIFGYSNLSSKLTKAPRIDNYLGFYGMSGEEIKDKFVQHINKMEIKITNERINNVYALGDKFALMVADKVYEAKAIVLATGVQYGNLLEGEKEYLGKGVGYCATCDAPLYRNKIVTIIAHNKMGEDEARYVSEFAKEVYYVPMYEGHIDINEKVKIIKDIPVKIEGTEGVSKLVLKNRDIETNSVFILKDVLEPEELVPGLEMDGIHIKVNRNFETNIPGCYAAGDCTGKPYQYIKAAGEGNVASLNAIQYLNKINKDINK